MNIRTSQNQKLNEKHFYALLGLSEPKIPDEVVGASVPFKLSNAERQFMLEESELAKDVESAIEAAHQFFAKSFPRGFIYFKNSRFYRAGVLKTLKYEETLNDLKWL